MPRESPQPGPSWKHSGYKDDEPMTKERNVETQKADKPEKREEEEPKIHFHCETCDMNEFCHYYGKRPPFVNRITFLEDCFVMRDPFAPPPRRGQSKPEYFIVLGSKCSKCKRIVCKANECSFFYVKTYCLKCAEDNIKNFPTEVRTKIKKQLSSVKNITD